MTTITGANTEQPTYDAIIKKTFSRIHERPTRQDRDQLHKEVEHVLVDINVPHLEWSGKYGLLAEARTQTTYRNLSVNTYHEPSRTEPAMSDPTITSVESDFDKDNK